MIGEDPLRIEHHWQRLYRFAPFRGSVLSGTVSAVDIALWDIKGQRLQAPIPNFVVREYSRVDEGPAAAPFIGRLQCQGGYLPVPEAPGLGIRLDDSRIATAEPVVAITCSTPLRADSSVGYAR